LYNKQVEIETSTIGKLKSEDMKKENEKEKRTAIVRLIRF